MNPTVGLSVELFNAIVNYLVSRPYSEVANMIAGMNQAAQAAQAAQQTTPDTVPSSTEQA